MIADAAVGTASDLWQNYIVADDEVLAGEVSLVMQTIYHATFVLLHDKIIA